MCGSSHGLLVKYFICPGRYVFLLKSLCQHPYIAGFSYFCFWFPYFPCMAQTAGWMNGDSTFPTLRTKDASSALPRATELPSVGGAKKGHFESLPELFQGIDSISSVRFSGRHGSEWLVAYETWFPETWNSEYGDLFVSVDNSRSVYLIEFPKHLSTSSHSTWASYQLMRIYRAATSSAFRWSGPKFCAEITNIQLVSRIGSILLTEFLLWTSENSSPISGSAAITK